MGSTNGTSMNEQQLVPQREYPLQEGDRIVIGEFTILFSLQQLQTNGMAHSVVEEPRTAIQSGDVDALVYELCRRYAELSGCTTKEREAGAIGYAAPGLGTAKWDRCESLIRKCKAGFRYDTGGRRSVLYLLIAATFNHRLLLTVSVRLPTKASLR